MSAWSRIKSSARRVAAVVIEGANFKVFANPAGRLVTVLSTVGSTVQTAAGRLSSRLVGTTRQAPATAVSPYASGAAANAAQRPAPAMQKGFLSGQTISGQDVPAPAIPLTPLGGTGRVPQAPAGNMVQLTFDLTHEGYATAASNSPGSGWTNPNNIIGAEDGAYSELEEGLLLVTGTISASFATQVNRDDLTIESVEVDSYHKTENINLLASALTIQVRLGALGTPTTLEAINNDEDHLTTPRTYDITSFIGGSWGNINDLLFEYNGSIVVDAGTTLYQVDAAKLRITASLTEAI